MVVIMVFNRYHSDNDCIIINVLFYIIIFNCYYHDHYKNTLSNKNE